MEQGHHRLVALADSHSNLQEREERRSCRRDVGRRVREGRHSHNQQEHSREQAVDSPEEPVDSLEEAVDSPEEAVDSPEEPYEGMWDTVQAFGYFEQFGQGVHASRRDWH